MKKVSLHRLRVFDFVAKGGGWVSSRQIAAGAEVAERTARAHASEFVRLGVFEGSSSTFPGTLYRVAAKPKPSVLRRLDEARNVLVEARHAAR